MKLRDIIALASDLGLVEEIEILSKLPDLSEPFDVADANDLLKLTNYQAQGDRVVQLGGSGAVSLSLEGSVSSIVEIIWSEANNNDRVDRYIEEQVDFEKEAVIIVELFAAGTLKGEREVPIASYLKLGVGNSVSMDTGYFHYMKFDRSHVAKDVLFDFARSLRWPFANKPQIKRPSILSGVELKGSLKLWGSLTAGYEARGSKGFEINGLKPEFIYQVKAGASLKLGLEVGGSFAVVTQKGHADDWVRLQVFKAKQLGVEVSAGIDIAGEVKVSGLISDPKELLNVLTGFNLGEAVEWLETIKELENAEAARGALKEKFGDLVSGAVGDLVEDVYASDDYQGAKVSIANILEDYKSFKESIDQRVLEQIKKYIGRGRIEDAKVVLDAILQASTAESLKEKIGQLDNSNDIWEFVEKVTGEDLFKLFTDSEYYTKFRGSLENAKILLDSDSDRFNYLKDWIEQIEKHLSVDKVVETVSLLTTLDGLQGLVVDPAGKLAARLFEFAVPDLDEIVFEKVKNAAVKLLNLRTKLAEELEKGFARKFGLSIVAAFSNRNESSALLDVEFNLNEDFSADLFSKAIDGDFEPALEAASSPLVFVREGVFQQTVARKRELKLHAFGWGLESIRTIDQQSKIVVKEQGGGSVLLYDSATAAKAVKKSGFSLNETLSTTYAMNAQARMVWEPSSRQDVEDVFEDFSSCYNVIESDKSPSWEELGESLTLAKELGLIEDVSAYCEELKNDFGDRALKRIDLEYTIKYGGTPWEAVFLGTGWDGDRNTEATERYFDLASASFRRFYADWHRNARNPFFSDESLQRYLAYEKITREHTGGRRSGGRPKFKLESKNLPTIYTGMNYGQLSLACAQEVEFIDALQKIDEAFDGILGQRRPKKSLFKKLDKAVGELLEVPIKKPYIWKTNIFFLVMDSIIQGYSPAARVGKTFLELKLDFDDEKGTVRRFATV